MKNENREMQCNKDSVPDEHAAQRQICRLKNTLKKKIKAYVFGHMNKYLYLLPFVSTGRFWCN